MLPADIIDRYNNGDKIGDLELIDAIEFFEDLALKLNQCGPIMLLAAKEATRIRNGLDAYAESRKLK